MDESAVRVLLNKIENNLQPQEKLKVIIDNLIELGYDGLFTDCNNVTPLIYTVKCNHKELTERLLNHYKDIDIKDTIFSKPVHVEHEIGDCLFDGAPYASSNLIKMVNKRDSDGKSALDYAVSLKYYGIACSLVLHGAEISSLNVEDKSSLLLYADDEAYKSSVSIGDHELRPVVGLLAIKVPKAVEKYSKDYRYPRLLSYFSFKGHSKVVATLIDSIRDDDTVEVILNTIDNGGSQLDKANNNSELADYDHLQIIKYLFEHGATNNANHVDPIHLTLLSAAQRGHTETFKYFAHKADKNHFNTYIGLATIDYHVNLIEYIWNNYQEYTVTKQGDSALHYATWKGNLKSVKYLCDNGAEISCINDSGETPLDNAIEFNHKDVIVYLIKECDAQLGKEYNRNVYMSMRRLLCAEHDDINQIDVLGNTALHYASKSGDIASAKHFIDQGVDINKPNVYGITPLHLAAQQYNGNVTMILLLHGVIYNTTTKEHKTALDLAKPQSKSMLQVVDKLFRSKHLFQDLNEAITSLASYDGPYDPRNPMIFLMTVKDKNRQTLLHKAVTLNDKAALRLILEYNQSYIKLKSTKPSVLVWIREYVPVDSSQQDSDGNTPLHIAAYNGNIDIVKMLLKEDPSIVVKNNLGHTPIFTAGHNNHKSTVELLVKWLGSSQTAKTDKMQTSESKDLACQVKKDLKI